MSDERVRIGVDAEGIAEVVLARPAKLNALDAPMFEALDAALGRLADEPRLRAVVLRGDGRAFCAGLDIGSFAGALPGPGERVPASGSLAAGMADLVARTHGIANVFQHVVWGWRALPVPVIAAVHGVAFGGGLQIALGADIRLAAADARFSVMEVKWGLVPDMAGCALLPGLVRDDVLRELVYTGRVVDAVEAVSIGLATRVVDDPVREAMALARMIATQSPSAIRAGKRLLGASRQGRPEEVLLAEAREQQRLLGSAEQRGAATAGLRSTLASPTPTQP